MGEGVGGRAGGRVSGSVIPSGEVLDLLAGHEPEPGLEAVDADEGEVASDHRERDIPVVKK